MAKIRSQSDITQGLLSFFKTAQPLLNMSPGSVARDLFIEGYSLELSKLYNVVSEISRTQSLRL